MRRASKSFLEALAKSRTMRCRASHAGHKCEREAWHKGRHLFTFPDGSTEQWTDKSGDTKGPAR